MESKQEEKFVLKQAAEELKKKQEEQKGETPAKEEKPAAKAEAGKKEGKKEEKKREIVLERLYTIPLKRFLHDRSQSKRYKRHGPTVRAFAAKHFKTAEENVRMDNKVSILPKNAPEKLERQVEKVLHTRPVRIYVDQSPLLGVFAALNDNGCVLQELSEKHEQNVLKGEGLNLCILKNFSPGINILTNSKTCLLNPEISAADAKRIGDCLVVEIVRQRAGIKTVGAVNVVTDKGLLAHNETSEIELKYLEKFFGVRGLVGTTNFGQAYNGFSVIANNHGALAGITTTGIEMQRIFEALGG